MIWHFFKALKVGEQFDWGLWKLVKLCCRWCSAVSSVDFCPVSSAVAVNWWLEPMVRTDDQNWPIRTDEELMIRTLVCCTFVVECNYFMCINSVEKLHSGITFWWWWGFGRCDVLLYAVVCTSAPPPPNSSPPHPPPHPMSFSVVCVCVCKLACICSFMALCMWSYVCVCVHTCLCACMCVCVCDLVCGCFCHALYENVCNFDVL